MSLINEKALLRDLISPGWKTWRWSDLRKSYARKPKGGKKSLEKVRRGMCGYRVKKKLGNETHWSHSGTQTRVQLWGKTGGGPRGEHMNREKKKKLTLKIKTRGDTRSGCGILL